MRLVADMGLYRLYDAPEANSITLSRLQSRRTYSIMRLSSVLTLFGAGMTQCFLTSKGGENMFD